MSAIYVFWPHCTRCLEKNWIKDTTCTCYTYKEHSPECILQKNQRSLSYAKR